MKNNKFNTSNITTKCGVYWFKDINDNILYIGKAKNIKKRLEQYLNGSINSYKTPILVEKSNSVDYQICQNEKESLLLEQELIKKHKPYYNVLLLDDKKYPYIAIELKQNKIEFKTRFFYKNQPNSYYFGPLPPNYGYKTIKNFLIHECLYENGLPIENKNDPEFWRDKFEYAKKILSSSNNEIISKLKSQMIYASNNQQYELAKEYRDVIYYLTNNQQQSITFDDNKNFDVIAFEQYENYLMIIIHNFKNGSFFMQEDFIVEINVDLYESIVSFINQFYLMRNIPDFVVTNYEIFSEDLVINKSIIVPKKGQYYQALKNALNNIDVNKELKILKFKNRKNINIKVKNFLHSILNINVNDFIMIDNSNEANLDVVSVIIYYKNYVPHFKNYRKYSILHSNRKSDVEYIKQGLEKYFNNNEEVPDLIIVDGAIQQLNEAKKLLKKLNILLPIIGLVKNDKHQTDHILNSDGQKIEIKDNDIYNFFSKIQLEVDSFAKSFHSKKKLNSSLEGFLYSIKGIGEKTEKKLLDYFKTYSNIYNATEEELSKVVSKSIASKIIKKLGK
ncbi:MAG: excinuclease ABC subunit C [Mycoplasma sp.]|nr:excinuclease ABC subunit C [Mycoplasma sp.]